MANGEKRAKRARARNTADTDARGVARYGGA